LSRVRFNAAINTVYLWSWTKRSGLQIRSASR
jgi:hypothetical protein